MSMEKSPKVNENSRSKYIQDLRGDLTTILDHMNDKTITTDMDIDHITSINDNLIEYISGEFWEKYKSLRTIGQGCSAVVKKIQCRLTLKKYAAKIIRTHDEETIIKLKEEFNKLLTINHTNIIKMNKMYIDEGSGTVYILMEYFESITIGEVSETVQSLSDDIDKWREYEDRCRKYFYNIVLSIKHLHRCGVIHRDLNPGNILVNKGKYSVI